MVVLVGCEKGGLPDSDTDGDTDTEVCAAGDDICYKYGEREIESGWEGYIVIDIPCCDAEQRCERVTVPPGEDTETYRCVDWEPTQPPAQ